MNRVSQLCGVAALLLCQFAQAADRPEVGPVPAWVLPAAPAGTEPLASQAAVQILFTDHQLRVTPEFVETYEASRVRIQTPEGLGAMGTYRFTWRPDSDVLTLHKLTVTRNNQPLDLLGNGDAFTVLRREDQLDQAVLTGALTAVLQPPGLQVGDVIELSYTRRHKDPVVADSPDLAFIWPNAPIGQARFRALWPENLPLRWRASKHMPAGEPVKRDGWFELLYEVNKPVPLLQPTGAPARFAALRMVELTSFSNWPQLSQRLAPLYVKAAVLAPASPVRAEAARIRQQHATPAARAAAALRLVQDQIRYVLLAMNDGGLMPATAEETWQRKFGDCKGKTVLLLALLRELGIEAEPVLVSSNLGDGLNERLPALGLFDHVLVRARVDGKHYWLDGTNLGDRSLALLQPPDFQWGLPLLPRGAELIAIPREPLAEPMMTHAIDIDAREGVETPALFEAKFTVRGEFARAIKRGWDSTPEANRTEQQRSFWREQYLNLDIEKGDLAFDDEKGVLTWTVSGKIRLEWNPEYDTYDPPGSGIGYRADYSRPADTDANAPYLVNFPYFSSRTQTIRLPPQESPFIVTGTDIERTVAGAEYKRKARVLQDRFTLETSTRTIAPEFSASERTEAERVLLELSRNDLYLKKSKSYLPTRSELRAQANTILTSAGAYSTRGYHLEQRGMLADSTAAYTKALELDPKHEYSLAQRGQNHLRAGRYTAARTDLQSALELNEKNAPARRALATLEMQEGNLQRSIDLLQKLLEINPDAADLLLRATVRAAAGQHELALVDASAAIAKNRKLAGAYLLKGEVLRLLQRDTEIAALADALVRSYQNGEPPSYVVASNMLDLAGQRSRGLAVITEELRLRPSQQGYLLRATFQDEKSNALADLLAAEKQSGINRDVLTAILERQLNRTWWGEALETATRLEKMFGASATTTNLRGVAQWQMGNKTAAADAFAAAREKAVDARQLNTLCWDKARFAAALENALEECDAALAKEPTCGACVDSRALVLLRLGRLKESVDAYDESLRMNPSRFMSLYGRGLARIRMHQGEAGTRDIASARIFSPPVALEYRNMGLEP